VAIDSSILIRLQKTRQNTAGFYEVGKTRFRFLVYFFAMNSKNSANSWKKENS